MQPFLQRSKADAVSEARLRALQAMLARWRQGRRHVDYAEAAELAGRLAEGIRRVLSRDELETAELRAIPRGGLIVLGMLAYHLAARVEPPGSATGDVPLVLVDDCALTGYRLRREMARLPTGRRVVVAHLLSTPELRAAVEAAEPRVVACVAADDLRDSSREHWTPEERSEWARRLSARPQVGKRYWLGLPEPFSFAWSEPDHAFWNPATGTVEDGWRFEPPHRCLNSRARLLADLPALEPAADDSARYEVPGSVAWGEFEEQIWLVRGDDRQVFRLDGVAVLVWKALAIGWSEAGTAMALTRRFQVPAAAALDDVSELLRDLLENRLLQLAAE